MSLAYSAGPWPACMSSWWSRDLRAGHTHAPAKTGSARAAASSAVRGLTGVSWAEGREVESMQVIWMVTVTLMLALGGVLALALVTRLGAWTRRR
jgi:hypothetical protein